VQALIGFILIAKHLHMVMKYLKLEKFNVVKPANKVMATKLQAKKVRCWYHQSLSFTNRCTLCQPYKSLKFTLKLILKLLLHVSVYDCHQGAYT